MTPGHATRWELPPAPPGETGWPWMEQSEPLPGTMADGEPWPKVSIVTPSYNQGQFIEETIRSVLLQGYPNLEYIIIDGGSTDGSVETIRKYEPWLTYWVSEPDRGQAHAINKGFDVATGRLLGFINSDDLLLPNALAKIAAAHRSHPTAAILGDVYNFVDGRTRAQLIRQYNVTAENLVAHWTADWSWHQPGVFVPRGSHEDIGALDESLRYAFDRDWMIRLLMHGTPLHYLNEPLAAFRLHASSKTVGEAAQMRSEQLSVIERYAADVLPNLTAAEVHARYSLVEAVLHVSVYHIDSWDVGGALRAAWSSLMTWPRALLLWDLWRVLLRALCPLPIVRLIRPLWLRRRFNTLLPGTPRSDAVTAAWRPAHGRAE